MIKNWILWLDTLALKPAEVRRLRAGQWVLIGLVALGAAWGTGRLARVVPSDLLNGAINPDLYFTSDVSRVHSNMVTSQSNHRRTNVHPLFSILMHPAYVGVATLLGEDTEGNPRTVSALRVTRLMSMIASALVVGLFALILLRLGLKEWECLLMVALFVTSAFWVFWFSVPETYPWGVLSILLALVLSTFSRGSSRSIGWDFLASLGTLAITTTNWMVGLLVSLLRWGLKRAVVLAAVVLVFALGLATVQKVFFPTSSYFFRVSSEKNFVLKEDSGGVGPRLRSIIFHTYVVPTVEVGKHAHYEGKTTLRTQHSAPGSATRAGKVAAICWVGLLILGAYGLAVVPWYLPFRLAVGGFLSGQVLLHSVYGSETFLYSAHYGPVLLIGVAAALRTRAKWLAAGLAVVAVIAGAMNNYPEYYSLSRTISEITAAQAAAMGK